MSDRLYARTWLVTVAALIAAILGWSETTAASAPVEIALTPTAAAVSSQPDPSGTLELPQFELRLEVTGFIPGTELRVFLTQETIANRLQAAFVGSLTVRDNGRGRFRLEGLDLNRAFGLYSPVTPPNGIVTCQPGPVTPGQDMCEVVRLGAIQIYFAEPTAGLSRAFDADGESGPVAFVGVSVPPDLAP